MTAIRCVGDRELDVMFHSALISVNLVLYAYMCLEVDLDLYY